MISRMRKYFTPANAALTLALVLTMSGGAYAASKYLITSTKQISPKVLKQLKGAKGATGAVGPQGAAGAAGAAGKEGPAGKEGKEGLVGKEGKEGPIGPKGENGKDGKNGSPWTAGGTLPTGATETGTWAFGATAEGFLRVPVSFPIALEASLESTQVHYVNEAEPAPAGCLNGTFTKPEAEEGNLCVYSGGVGGLESGFTPSVRNPESPSLLVGAGTTGAFIFMKVEAGAQGSGTWAVTAK
jgi:hypothetical protein